MIRGSRAAVILIFWALVAQPLARAESVVLLYSSSNPLYQKIVAGFSAEFKEPFLALDLTPQGKGDQQIADATVFARSPRVLLGVGAAAMSWIRQKERRVPIVFCALSQALLEASRSAASTGVTIHPAVLDTLRAFQAINPAIRRLGLVHSRIWSVAFIESAREQAAKLGIELTARAVEYPKDLPPTLNDLFEKSEGFWMLQDPLLMKPEIVMQLLRLQLAKRIPLLTFSVPVVKKGALAAFRVEFEEQGRQAALLVKSILEGKKPAELPFLSPRGKLVINLSTAERLGLKLSKELLRRPDVEPID